MDPLTELSLFSGYGGFTLGLRLADVPVRTVCYVERDSYCQELIQARIRDGMLDDAPIWDDVRSFDGRPWRGCVDIITGGFPCQPYSKAGRRLGKKDPRNLWPDTCRIIREVGPRYVLLENVRGLADGADPYAAEVIGSLSEAGYDAIWGLHSAAEAGAPHLRGRWWCLAYPQSDSKRCVHREVTEHPTEATHESFGNIAPVDSTFSYTRCRSRNVADAEESRQPGTRRQSGTKSPSAGFAGSDWWQVEPPLGRVVDGYPGRVDELKALGNGIVPAVVREFLLG